MEIFSLFYYILLSDNYYLYVQALYILDFFFLSFFLSFFFAFEKVNFDSTQDTFNCLPVRIQIRYSLLCYQLEELEVSLEIKQQEGSKVL